MSFDVMYMAQLVECTVSCMQVPSIAPMAPQVEAQAGPVPQAVPVTGPPLTATPVLAPGTVAVITPPSYGNSTLPAELPASPLLASVTQPLLGAQPP